MADTLRESVYEISDLQKKKNIKGVNLKTLDDHLSMRESCAVVKRVIDESANLFDDFGSLPEVEPTL